MPVALKRYPAHRDAAYQQYETNQRPHVTHAQRTAGPGGDFVVPASQEDLDARDQRLRADTVRNGRP